MSQSWGKAMPARARQQKADLVDQVVGRVQQRMQGDKAAMAERFIRQFFANVPPDDITGHSPDNLYGMALSFWNFAAQRGPDETKSRVFTPSFEDYGWHTPHTVLEIVTNDRAFLVDSVTQALNERGLTVYLIVHPILWISRDADGQVAGLGTGSDDAGATDDGVAESFMQIHINEQSDTIAFDAIRNRIERVLHDVTISNRDWPRMRDQVRATLRDLEANPPPLPPAEVAEARALLSWIDDNNFTFLGYREYNFAGSGDEVRLEIVPGTSLGILEDQDYRIFDGLRNFATLPPDVRAFLRQPELLLINKTNSKSTVHRAVHMDAIFVKQFDADGTVCGEKLLCGLLTSSAYSARPRDIPVLRRKIKAVTDLAGFPPASHDAKRLIHIIENLPRDELFQGSMQELFDIGMGILHLQERQRIALFVRRDPFERFVSALVNVPRDRFDTALRVKFQGILEAGYAGPVTAYYTNMTDEVSARVQFILKTEPGALSDVDVREVEAKLVDAARSWVDHLQDAVIGSLGEGRGLAVMRRFASAFPTAYREYYGAQDGVRDIGQIDEVLDTGTLGIYLHQPLEADPDEARLKLVVADTAITLSDALPILEHMGFKVMGEMPFEIRPGGPDEAKRSVWIHDFSLKSAGGEAIDLAEVRRQFEDAVARIWTGDMEDDRFNRLVLTAGLDWRGVVVMRAYAKYLRQAAFTFSQDYLADTLSRYSGVTRDLFALFETLFDPRDQPAAADTGAGDGTDVGAGDRATAIRERITTSLDAVDSLDDDRILRRFFNLIDCTLRTNFYQPAAAGGHKPYLSFKLDSQRIEDLPAPRPMVEIFVYSPRVEAVHLRGGKVARGGLRWSDRREDFRTEILGLVKAQMVKNAVIVPVGSKGGFVVKRPPATGGREALLAEGIACYKTFIRGMLDLTDNLKGSEVVHPEAVVRRDGDDPYLVVAADKGTATFSDIANGVSQDYGFWLDDAFASGGSAGYDHKKMGITAKGAWESVKRHFREIDRDIQTTDVTCIGVGDMSGDVFGNGMLLSRHIRLIGAFNHLHIFVDPDPVDAGRTWEERQRLFDLPRSSWMDYDQSLISGGGGVFDRKAKTIAVTPEMRQVFDIDDDTVTPNGLIRAMLTAPVDLLWFGGIGTYVKSSDESHADAGDRATDALRVNGRDLQARVVGEGANLGVTQRGRIEYALAGGRINTDAVDNSAGVDCSDHEVNIKILLGAIVQNGDMTLKQRNALLEAMTDEVSELVLRDNYLQTLALTNMQMLGTRHLDPAQRFIRRLERSGRLDRANEFLPDDESLAERRSQRRGLTRPEMSVLLAYAKMVIYDTLLDSDLPDEALLAEDLRRYFPKVLQDRFAPQIEAHRLRREIIATFVTNSMVNRTGPTFVSELEERTGHGAGEIARAYAIVRDAFSLRPLWHDIEALDNKAPADLQNEMLREVTRLVNRCTLWFLRHGEHPLNIRENVDAYGPGVTALSESLLDLVSKENLDTVEMRAEGYIALGAPPQLAHRVAQLTQLSPSCDVVRISRRTAWPVEDVGRVYFYLGSRFGFDWVRRSARDLPVESHWHDMAVSAIVDDSVVNQIDLVQRVLETARTHSDGVAAMRLDKDDNGVPDLIDHWAAQRGAALRHVEDMLHDMRSVGSADIAMLAVANRELRVLLTD